MNDETGRWRRRVRATSHSGEHNPAAPLRAHGLLRAAAMRALSTLAFTLLAPLMACSSGPSPTVAGRSTATASAAASASTSSSAAEPIASASVAPSASEVASSVEPSASASADPPAHVFAHATVPAADTRVVVLEYHDFGTLNDAAVLEPEDFKAQLDWLTSHDIEVIRTSDLLDFLAKKIELPARVAVIMIDDALRSAKTVAYPALADRGMPFTLAINTKVVDNHPRALKWDDITELLGTGLCELASHSHVHGHMARMREAGIKKELDLSRQLIEEHTGIRVRSFVYPFGSSDDRVERLTKEAGYEAGFAASGAAARIDSPRFAVPRMGITRTTKMSKRFWEFDFTKQKKQKKKKAPSE
ncbi:MAG: polysaccharide deacetylase family protein [Polyangiaceae bacterium]